MKNIQKEAESILIKAYKNGGIIPTNITIIIINNEYGKKKID